MKMALICRRIITSLAFIKRVSNKDVYFRPLTTAILHHQLISTGQRKLLISSELRRNLTLSRHKSKKAQEDSDDEADYNDDSSLSKDSKVVKFSTTSMRTDGILKSALGVSRNKIEQAFYDSKIRVNGKKIMKKSAAVKEGDELDIIKAVSAKNPDHLHVSRVEILNVSAEDESISVTARRFKSLLIENYEQDPYKAISNNE